MKRVILLFSLVAFMSAAGRQAVYAQSGTELRHQYVMKHLKLDKATAEKFSPVCMEFLKEMKAAEAEYDKLKKKYKELEKNGTLTNAQAEQLLKAKFAKDEAELAVRRKYVDKFKAVLPMKKVYYAFDYANDKKSKVQGTE